MIIFLLKIFFIIFPFWLMYYLMIHWVQPGMKREAKKREKSGYPNMSDGPFENGLWLLAFIAIWSVCWGIANGGYFVVAYSVGLFMGLTIFIWIASVILTFIGKKFTKKEITHNTIIATTIIVGFICLLFGKWASEQLTIFVLLIFIIPLVIWGRFTSLKNNLQKQENIKK